MRRVFFLHHIQVLPCLQLYLPVALSSAFNREQKIDLFISLLLSSFYSECFIGRRAWKSSFNNCLNLKCGYVQIVAMDCYMSYLLDKLISRIL